MQGAAVPVTQCTVWCGPRQATHDAVVWPKGFSRGRFPIWAGRARYLPSILQLGVPLVLYWRLRRLVEDGERLKEERDTLTEEPFERRVHLLSQRLDQLLTWKIPTAVLKAVLEKVDRQKAYILTFVRYPGVPKTNNFGEYIVKRGILKRKLSGGSTSPKGATAYGCIQSVAMTCPSVPELVAAIHEYIAHHNTDPKPFIWTKSARDILQKVIRANRRLSSKQNEALH